MPGFNGTGPAGMGPMTGGGRGLCNPGAAWWGGASRFSRWPASGYSRYNAPQPFYTPPVSREQEMEYLKRQTDNLKRMLEGIDERIKQIAGEGG